MKKHAVLLMLLLLFGSNGLQRSFAQTESDELTIILGSPHTTLSMPITPGFVEWSPDGTMIAVASTEASCDLENPIEITTNIYNVETEMLVSTLTDTTCTIRDLAWSPDSTKLAVGSGDSIGVRVWDVQSGELLAQNQRGLQGGVLGLSWSPDGTQIGFSTMAAGTVIDAMTGENLVSFGGATTFDWSPDGNKIVSASAYDSSAYLNDSTTPDIVQIQIEGYSITGGIKWSPDGSRISATTSEDFENFKIMIWDDTFEPVVEISGHDTPIIRSIWSPDSTKIWTAGQDNMIRVWDTSTGDLLGEYQHPGLLGDFDLNPDGQQIVISDPLNQQIEIRQVANLAESDEAATP